MMYRQFFASELPRTCALPEFERKVTIIYAGGDDFAVYGAWDALIPLAREIQRLFSVFVDTNLKEYTGLEGKTISMAVALARSSDEPLASVLDQAARKLDVAKASGKDCIYLFGRTLEWKQLADAAESRHTMTRLITDFGVSPQFLHELAAFYAEAEEPTGAVSGGRGRHDRVDRPWRFHRRLNTVLGTSKQRDFQRVRAELINDFTSRRAKQIRLRPEGRVALEWAWLETSLQTTGMMG
jgi:CRISPR-associated protein Csm1